MIGIILEGVLFVALLATMAALLFFALLYLTPVRSATRRPYMSSAMGERVGRLGSGGLGRLVKLAAIGVAVLVPLVLIPTAMTYINPGHVGIVIHRIGGGVVR